MIDAGLIAARFVHYLALAIAFGAVLYGHYGRGEGLEGVRRRLDRLSMVGALGVMAGAAALLMLTVAGMGGGFASLGDAPLWRAVLLETDFGRVWIARLVLAGGLVGVTMGLSERPSPARRVALGLAGLLLLSVALTGHATSHDGPMGLLHRATDAVHLLAAGVWIGALPPLLFLLSAARRDVGASTHAARRLREFHGIGLIAVAALVASGLVNSALLVSDFPALIGSPYGRVLAVKLCLFLGMLALAASNRWRAAPRLDHAVDKGGDIRAPIHLLRRQIRMELVISLLVLGAVAVLGTLSPTMP
ncbi:copper homeostasis membrane protein CopD [Brevundimonas sp. 2R-24]|uniref:Copper homeostasis membrane protein CopD n=1 Tax=Peiella sedimenti TaxID=3061083 RepID=A0ABT8SLU9_9CAUL|nr:copper homeostasis membrane protein CopD [Caulobacteraceae bacterium XZ-24]